MIESSPKIFNVEKFALARIEKEITEDIPSKKLLEIKQSELESQLKNQEVIVCLLCNGISNPAVYCLTCGNLFC
jgi:hypothetical protein